MWQSLYPSLLLLGTFSMVAAADKEDAQVMVDKAKATFTSIMSDSNFSWLHKRLKDAKGVVIFPQVLKAGFFLGGTGGTGVVSGPECRKPADGATRHSIPLAR